MASKEEAKQSQKMELFSFTKQKKVLGQEDQEIEVFKLTKSCFKNIIGSEDYSIFWSLLFEETAPFIIDHEYAPNQVIAMDCSLNFLKTFEEYFNFSLEIHSKRFIDYPFNLCRNMHITLSIIDNNKRIRNSFTQVLKTIDQNIITLNFEKFIKISEVVEDASSLLSNKDLKVHCRIYFGDSKDLEY